MHGTLRFGGWEWYIESWGWEWYIEIWMVRTGKLLPSIIWSLWNQHIEPGCIEVVTFVGV